jgi:acyl-lipid omega-6 desaturase (Delta-12 desaturase)
MYRTLPGLCFFYLIEIWWKIQIFPSGWKKPKNRLLRFHMDRLLVLFFLAIELFLLATVKAGSAGKSIILGFVVPFLAWNWLSGFFTFLQHTNPRVPWYANEKEYDFLSRQLRASVHVELPVVFDRLLHNVMQHTAHHIDPRIPLYNLIASQRLLELNYGSEITCERLTARNVRLTMRTCKLYDYENHCWLDFDGTALTAPLR